jgi:ABC-type sugar transport system ATPase subunit
MTLAIEVLGVTVESAGTPVLVNVNLSVATGESVVVAGPSGAGKSTLLRLVLGLAPPSAGIVRLRGRTVSEGRRVEVPPAERGLGMVFQDLALWPHLTVHGNLAFALDAARVARDAREERIERTLELVGLHGHARRRPGELSGGERQRVAIARVLVQEPDAILFDEPLANLDVARKRELVELFRHLLRERSASAIYVTHDPREAAMLADRVAILERGRVVQVGTHRELLESPATPFAEAFAAEMPER